MLKRIVYTLSRLSRKTLLGLIILYQWLLSPLFGNCCRFYPSCSRYSQDAIRQYGIGKGVMLSLWRLLRCHPFHAGGYDPVPQSTKVEN